MSAPQITLEQFADKVLNTFREHVEGKAKTTGFPDFADLHADLDTLSDLAVLEFFATFPDAEPGALEAAFRAVLPLALPSGGVQ